MTSKAINISITEKKDENKKVPIEKLYKDIEFTIRLLKTLNSICYE